MSLPLALSSGPLTFNVIFIAALLHAPSSTRIEGKSSRMSSRGIKSARSLMANVKAKDTEDMLVKASAWTTFER